MDATDTQQRARRELLSAAAALGLGGAELGAAPQLIATLCDPECSVAEVAKVAKLQPVVYAKILRVANSAFYGQSRTVASLTRAVTILGLDAVRGIAAAACLGQAIRRGAGASALALRPVLRHCLATAAAAETLSRQYLPDGASDAFVAGLLHNLGIALQSRLYPEGIQQLLDRIAGGEPGGIRDLEAACGLIGHETAMAQVYEDWALPEDIIQSTRHHHRCELAPNRVQKFAALVGLSAHLASRCGYSHPFEAASLQPRPEDLASLAIESSELDAVLNQLPDRIACLEQALN